MTDKKTGVDIEFDKLTPEQQEAYVPRGEYKDPAALDQGNAPKGAPTGPVAADDESVGEPNPATVDPNDDPAPAAKRGGKRT